MISSFVVAGAAILSWVLTAQVRRYAIAHRVLDIPNERSSHVTPTPRGGGLAIVVTSQVALAALVIAELVSPSVGLALGPAGCAVALIGWVDDRRSVPPYLRALVHAVAATWAVLWLGGFPRIALGGAVLDLGVAGVPLAVFGVVWSTNLYNFMDGIDGLAATEALVVGAAGSALLAASGHPGLAALSASVAASAGGFLAWNWAPARIFMGDVASGYLGFVFGALAVASDNAGGPSVVTWAILFGVFLADATITLLRRVARGERWYSAHRLHAYQRAADLVGRHSPVTLVVLGLNVVLVLLAWLGNSSPRMMPVAVVGASLLLGLAYALVERLRPIPVASDERRLEKDHGGD